MAPMRGLKNFITAIREAPSKELEQQKINQELAHIRKKFNKKQLDGYGRKKYLWKLVYMYMLGYNINFGHMEAFNLISKKKFTEKSAGYIACSILMNENNELLRMIIQSVKGDLQSENEFNSCLALAVIANCGGEEFAQNLVQDVQKLMFSTYRNSIKKKASLTLLRLFRKYPEAIPPGEDFAPQLIQFIKSNESSYGILTSLMSLVIGLISYDPTGYKGIVPRVVHILSQIYNETSSNFKNYFYYHTVCPWLQVKLFKVLQYFPPPEEGSIKKKLIKVLTSIIGRTRAKEENINQNNAHHAILFEAINLVTHMCRHGVMDLHSSVVSIVIGYIRVKEPNIRYLALSAMGKLARVPETLPFIRKQQQLIGYSLKDADISIKKRALNLLYEICDKSNSETIIPELIKYLKKCDYNIREEFVLLIAILAEKFAPDYTWYVDVIIQLITIAGDFVTEDIWYRLVHIVTNNEELQEYAATSCFEALKEQDVHENGLKVFSYIIGEFAQYIEQDIATAHDVFAVLNKRYHTCGEDTKAILLTAYIKLTNVFPDLKDSVTEVFKQHLVVGSTELQQRALEYNALCNLEDEDLVNDILDTMPAYQIRESKLIKKIRARDKDTQWGDTKKPEDEEDEDEDNLTEESDDEKKYEDEDEDEEEYEDEEDVEGEYENEEYDEDEKHAESSGEEDEEYEEDELSVFDQPQDTAKIVGILANGSGLLYQNELMKIGAKILPGDKNVHQVKLIIFCSNLSDQPMNNLTITVKSSVGGTMQIKPQNGMTIKSGEQKPHYVLTTSHAPFGVSPTVTVSMEFDGSNIEFDLVLPIVMSQFMHPWKIQKQQFGGAWKKLKHETKKVLTPGMTVSAKTAKTILERILHTSYVAPDPNPENIHGAGYFCAILPKNKQIANVQALVRIETKKNREQIRVIIHSQSDKVSKHIMNLLEVIFKCKKLNSI